MCVFCCSAGICGPAHDQTATRTHHVWLPPSVIVTSLFVCQDLEQNLAPQCRSNNWVNVPVFCDRFSLITRVISGLETHPHPYFFPSLCFPVSVACLAVMQHTHTFSGDFVDETFGPKSAVLPPPFHPVCIISFLNSADILVFNGRRGALRC